MCPFVCPVTSKGVNPAKSVGNFMAAATSTESGSLAGFLGVKSDERTTDIISRYLFKSVGQSAIALSYGQTTRTGN